MRLGALALSSKKTSSQLVSDSKSSIEELCIGRLLCLKAIMTLVSQLKSKYDVNGTLDWQTVIGHFADAKAAKKKLTMKNVGQRNGTENAHHKDGKVTKAKAKASPAQKKATKPKDKPVTSAAPKITSTSIKQPSKTKIETIAEKSEAPTATTMIDPFFITNDGSNYLSTAVIDRVQADGPDDDLNRRSRRINRLNTNSAVPKTHAKNDKFTKSTPKMTSFGGLTKNDARINVPANADVDVHPSWSAKRKQKSIPAFEGKRMKFDGSESKVSTVSSVKSPNNVEEKLHPSWAAKQKLKPIISEFKGSKITFD